MAIAEAERTIPAISDEIRRAIVETDRVSSIWDRIERVTPNTDSAMDELVRLVESDAAISGRMITLVNSPLYGFPNRIGSVAEAVTLMGTRAVKQFCMTSGLLGILSVNDVRFPLATITFRHHSLSTAVAAKAIAEHLSLAGELIESLFIAGLLHDIGKVLLVRVSTGRYAKALSESAELGISLDFAEIAHFGCSHAQVGAELCRSWGVSAPLIRAIEHHHHVSRGRGEIMTDVLAIANNLSKQLNPGESGNPVIEEVFGDIPARLGIQAHFLSRLISQLPQKVAEIPMF